MLEIKVLRSQCATRDRRVLRYLGAVDRSGGAAAPVDQSSGIQGTLMFSLLPF